MEKNNQFKALSVTLRIVVVCLLVVFSISFVSALKWDNIKSYNEETKEITVKNGFGFGDDVAKIKLKTPLNMQVGTGYQKVAEFDLEYFKDNNGGLDIVDFFDIKNNMQEINREFDYKIKIIKEIEIPEYDCYPVIGLNGSLERKCIEDGFRYEDKVTWEDFDFNNLEKDEEVTIGIFTDVKFNDKVEWIPTYFGVEIEEWASWTANLNVGLVSYYSLDGNYTDQLGVNDGTNIGTVFVNGIINQSANFTESESDYINLSSSLTLNPDDITTSTWVYRNGVSGGDMIITRWDKNGVDQNSYAVSVNATGNVRVDYSTENSAGLQISNLTIGINEWYHIAWTYDNVIGGALYINGTLTNTSVGTGNLNNSADWGTYLGSLTGNPATAEWDGRIDEVGIWNRSLTDVEIVKLWNNGDGLGYLNKLTVILNSPIDNFNSSINTILFNCTGTTGIIENNITNMSVYTNESGTWEAKNITIGLNSPDETQTWTRTISDGNYLWTCYVCDDDGSCSFAEENRTLLVDTTFTIINVETPTSLIDYNFIGGNETLNVTFIDTNLDSCWYNYNGTNVTIGGCLNGVKNSTLFILEEDNFNMTIYANDTLGNENSTFIEWDYRLLANSINFPEETTSGAHENFIINITISDQFSGISMLLNYNGTNISMTSTDINLTREYITEIIIPSVTTETNVTFFFIAQLSNATEITRIDTDNTNQTIRPFLIDNCTTFTNKLIIFEMLDEDSLQGINGTIETTINIFSIGTTILVRSFNNSFSYIVGEESAVCLDNITEEYSMSYQIRHFGDTLQYFKKYRNIQLKTINNGTIPENITLYNLNLSRGHSFNVIVVGNILSAVGNAGLLVDTQRQYLALNQFISIESPITDSSGIAISNLVQAEEIYNFLISYNGELLGTFNNYQVKCANAALGQCSITLNLGTATGTPPDFSTAGNVTQIFLLNTDTNTLHHTFSSTDGESKAVRSLVIKDDGYGNTTICNNSATGTSGTILCPIPTQFQNVSIFVQTFISESLLGSTFFSQGPTVDWQGADILILLLMFSSLVLLFIGHPIAIIIGASLGLIMPVILISVAGVSFGSLVGATFFYIAAGIIAIIIIRKKKN